jgi:hypothetical protein
MPPALANSPPGWRGLLAAPTSGPWGFPRGPVKRSNKSVGSIPSGIVMDAVERFFVGMAIAGFIGLFVTVGWFMR